MEVSSISTSILTHFDRCTGCRICQLVCSYHICGGYNPERSVLAIYAYLENLVHEPIVCEQCSSPYCQNVCPTSAIELNESTGARKVDPDVCIGCGTCEKYCPRGVIYLDPERKKAVKCDLCGGDPECVKACPTAALELIPRRPS